MTGATWMLLLSRPNRDSCLYWIAHRRSALASRGTGRSTIRCPRRTLFENAAVSNSAKAVCTQSFTEKDVNPYLPEEEQNCIRQLLRESRNEGLFTPPAFEDYRDAWE
jgi:hypothetical protein